MRGPKPSEKRSTLTSNSFANTKCPSSCTRISTPSKHQDGRRDPEHAHDGKLASQIDTVGPSAVRVAVRARPRRTLRWPAPPRPRPAAAPSSRRRAPRWRPPADRRCRAAGARVPRRAAGRPCSSRGSGASRPAPGPPGSPRRPRSAARAPDRPRRRRAAADRPRPAPPAWRGTRAPRSRGRSRMKPTVSVMMISRSRGSRSRRVVGSSVANSLSSASTSLLRERVEQRRLAGVGVADDRDDRQPACARARRAARAAARRSGSISFSRRWMRSRARRRFSRAWSRRGRARRCRRSAGDIIVFFSCRRGSVYLSCASSTCSLPSRLFARCAKMSRISIVRSMTLSSVEVGDRVRLDGVRSGSKTSTFGVELHRADQHLLQLAAADQRLADRPPGGAARPRPSRARRRCGTAPSARATRALRAGGRSARRCPAPATAAGCRRPPAARDRACRSRRPRARRARTPPPAPRSARRDPACCAKNGSVGSSAPRLLALDSAAAGERRADRPGRPSGHTPIAATRSSRSSARSTRSSRVSGSLRRCVCTSRRPRKRPRPARMRPISGRLMREASPTNTCSISPAPPDQDPDLALDLARDAHTGSAASSADATSPGRSRRRYTRSSACFWLGLSPVILPLTTCRAREVSTAGARCRSFATT